MDMLLLLLTFLHLFSHPSEVLHDFHMSKTEVHYNDSRHTLEVSLHVFIDDLEQAIIESGVDTLHLSTSLEHRRADEYIGAYLNQHFALVVNGLPVKLNFIGKEESPDLLALWCYLEGVDIEHPREVSIQNKVLTEIFDDQQNMVVFTAAGLRKFVLLDKDRTELTLTLK